MVLPTLLAALVPGASLTREAEAARPPARATAVFLTAIAGQADEEPIAAKRAEELKLRGLAVHLHSADGRELDAAPTMGDKKPIR